MHETHHRMNNIRYLSLFLLFNVVLISGSLTGQSACSVEQSRLETHVYILAADSLGGRMSGEVGQKMAADYIAQEFRNAGVQPFLSDTGYFQPFALYKRTPAMVSFLGQRSAVKATVVGTDAAMVGDGCSLIYADPASPVIRAVIENPEAWIVIPSSGIKKASKEIRKRYQEGIRRFVIVTEGTGWELVLLQESMPDRSYGLNPEYKTGKLNQLIHKADSAVVVVMRPAELARIIGYRPDFDMINKSLLKSGGFTQLGSKSGCAYIPQQLDSVVTENVMGWIEGAKGTQEVIVFTAHYDHVGVENNAIHNGADDNASGTAALIEIARVLQCRKDAGEPFKRSVLFLAVSAEELGLLGSQYFVNSPLFDSIQPILNQNMDMIGRSIQYGMIRSMILREGDGLTEDPAKRQRYVYLMNKKKGTKTYVRYAKRAASEHPGFRIDRTPGLLERLTFRHGSDHANFLKKGVPVLVWFTGLHPDYHTPRDDAEKIDYENMTTITHVIVNTTTRIINR